MLYWRRGCSIGAWTARRKVGQLSLCYFKTLNCWLRSALRRCFRFVLCAEGKRAAEKKTKEQFQRPSVESTVENFLEDVDFPPDPLKKRAMGETQLTGSVKFFVNITHNGERERLPCHARSARLQSSLSFCTLALGLIPCE